MMSYWHWVVAMLNCINANSRRRRQNKLTIYLADTVKSETRLTHSPTLFYNSSNTKNRG